MQRDPRPLGWSPLWSWASHSLWSWLCGETKKNAFIFWETSALQLAHNITNMSMNFSCEWLKESKSRLRQLTFAVFKDRIVLVWTVMRRVAVGPRLCLQLCFLLLELLVYLLLPGLWGQVRAPLPLALGQRVHRAFGFGPIQAALEFLQGFFWAGQQGHLELGYFVIWFLSHREGTDHVSMIIKVCFEKFNCDKLTRKKCPDHSYGQHLHEHFFHFCQAGCISWKLF